MSGSSDAPFSYRGAINDLRQVRTEAESATGEDEVSQANARKSALMHRLQEGSASQLGGGVAVDRCVFQSVKIDKGFDFSGMLPEDPEDEAIAGGESGRNAKGRLASKDAKRRSEKPFEISIPLSSDRVKLADVKKSLKTEYAARYCEALGVSPTPQNIALVNKHMPLDKCKLTQVFQPGLGRGERRNHVAIQPGYHHGVGPTTGGAKHAAGSGDGIRGFVAPFEVLPKQVTLDRRNTSVGHPSSTSPGPAAAGGLRQPHFGTYRDKFVFPYNLRERFETRAVPADEAEDKEFAGDEQGVELPVGAEKMAPSANLEPHAPETSAFDSRHISAAKRLRAHDSLLAKLSSTTAEVGLDKGVIESAEREIGPEHAQQLEALLEGRVPPPESFAFGGKPTVRRERGEATASANGVGSSSASLAPAPPRRFVGKEHVDAAIQRELEAAHGEFDEAEVRGVASQVASDFPFERLGNGPDTQLAVARARGFLTSGPVASLAVLLLEFLFAAYIAPLAPAHASAITPSQKDDMFVALYTRLAALVQRKVGRAHIQLELPLFILVLRVVVETEFSARFPAFVSCRHGRDVLHRMDAFAMAVLDPMGMLSRIPALESAPQALRVMHSKRLPPRFTPTATTPLAQFILGDSLTSTKAKALAKPHPLVREGLEELKAHLTPMVRSRLLAIMVDHKLHAAGVKSERQ